MLIERNRKCQILQSVRGGGKGGHKVRMGIFSGEGLGQKFPLGGGAIFQPRGGPGGLSYWIFPVQMLILAIT